MNLKLLNKFYSERKPQLELLIEKVIQSRRTSFQQNDDDIIQLQEEGILIFQEHEYSVNYTDEITYTISRLLLGKYNLEIPQKFDEVIKSFEIIETELRKNSFILGLSELEDKICAFWFVYLKNVENLDLEEFVKSYLEDELVHKIHELSQQIGEAIPKLIIGKEELYRILKVFVEKNQDPNQHFYDLFQGIRKYSKEQSNGKEFWLYIIDNGNEGFEGVVTQGLLGLYERNPSSIFDEFMNLLKNKQWLYSCIHAACFCEIFSKEHLNKLFEIIYSIKNNDLKILHQIVWFYCKIVDKNLVEDKNIDLASKKILELSKSESSKIQCIVLSNIRFTKNNDSLKYEIMQNMNLSDDNVLAHIKNIIYDFEDLDYFFKILKKCILHLKDEFSSNEFKHSISCALHKDKANFEKGIIKLLVDDLGIVRWGANRIIMQNGALFQVDLCTYDEIHQIRIFKSLCMLYSDYSFLIALILPFRKTINQSVFILFLEEIKKLIFDYPSQAFEILEKELNEADDKMLLDLFKKYKSDLFDYIDRKVLINEFNPKLSMAKLFSDFNTKYYEQYSEAMAKSMESSDHFFNHISKITVARGSGFKISGSDTGIAPMNTISHGFSLPRTSLILSEKTDWEITRKVNSNYKNKITNKNE